MSKRGWEIGGFSYVEVLAIIVGDRPAWPCPASSPGETHSRAYSLGGSRWREAAATFSGCLGRRLKLAILVPGALISEFGPLGHSYTSFLFSNPHHLMIKGSRGVSISSAWSRSVALLDSLLTPKIQMCLLMPFLWKAGESCLTL